MMTYNVRHATLEETIREKTTRKAEAEDFIRELMKQPALITEFDPITYHILVDRMTVFKKDRVVVRFKNGVEIEAWDDKLLLETTGACLI